MMTYILGIAVIFLAWLSKVWFDSQLQPVLGSSIAFDALVDTASYLFAYIAFLVIGLLSFVVLGKRIDPEYKIETKTIIPIVALVIIPLCLVLGPVLSLLR